MFAIRKVDDETLALSGRFDASQVQKAQAVLDDINTSTTLDFGELEYISSAGLGVLLATYKRLEGTGHQLTLRNMRKLVRDVFKYSRMDTLFTIE